MRPARLLPLSVSVSPCELKPTTEGGGVQVRPPAVMSMAAAVGAGGDHMDVCEAIRSLLAGATAETVVIKKEATPAVATQ